MSDRTKIEWTGATWNPIRARNRQTGKVGWYCQKVSPGCAHCYAEKWNGWRGNGVPYAADKRGEVELFLDTRVLEAPLRWRQPRMIFTCSMTDLFAEFHSASWVVRIFEVMEAASQHTFQVLTKRPERIEPVLYGEEGRWYLGGGDHLPDNVWLGVSVENQQTADARIPKLLKSAKLLPAAIYYVSYEPALGPADFRAWLGTAPFPPCAVCGCASPEQAEARECGCDAWPCIRRVGAGLAWAIAGGESGPKARPANPDWFRSVRDQCQAAGVPFFHKQNGEFLDSEAALAILGEDHPIFRDCAGSRINRRIDRGALRHLEGVTMVRVGKRAAGRQLDGREWNEFPESRERPSL